MNQNYEQFVSYDEGAPEIFDEFDFSFLQKEIEGPAFLLDSYEQNTFDSPNYCQQSDSSSNNHMNNFNRAEPFILSKHFVILNITIK